MDRQELPVGVAVCIVAFVSCAVLMAFTRSPFDPSWFGDPQSGIAWLTPHSQFERSAGRPNLRLVGSLLGQAVLWLHHGLLELQFGGLDPKIVERVGRAMAGHADNPGLVSGGYAVTSAVIVFVCLTLTPLLLFTLGDRHAAWRRTVLVVVLMSGLAGWPEPISTAMFSVFNRLVDWPNAYFLFATRYASYDFVVVGVVFVLALYLIRRRQMPVWELAGLTVLAQLTFEHLGLVFACAVFARTYLEGDGAALAPLWPAVRKMAVILAVAAVTAGLVAALFYALGNRVVDTVPGLKPWQANFESRMHFVWILCIMFSMLAPAAVVGAVLGTLFGLKPETRSDEARPCREIAVLAGLFVGFLLVLAVGFFTAYYPSELGRQMLPMIPVTVLLSAKVCEYFVRRAFAPARAG
jgi:hypothetical protein